MKLYITPTSPYARLARIVVLEKDLAAKVEVLIAETRKPGSPYYAVNPSGRVPFLVRDDHVGMEDSQLIAAYLDALEGRPSLSPSLSQHDWAYGRLETYARSMVDGLSVYARELRRPEHERSPRVIAHEADRALRLAEFWEHEVGHPLMQGAPNVAQLLLIIALDFAVFHGQADLETGRPKLTAWAQRIRGQASVRATRPEA